MRFGSPEAARGAADAITAIEKMACWRLGWRGWGWYHHCGPGPVVEEEVWEHEPECRDVTVRERRAGETVVRRIHRCD
jgi:hypothetical protein